MLLIGMTGLLPGMAVGADFFADTRAYNLAHGRVVFTEHCLECHGRGRKGAPILEDLEWLPRIEQSLAELIQHAVEGHDDMPPKGDLDIPDQDVAAAVAFVVDRTRNLAIEQLNDLPQTAAGGIDDGGAAPENNAVVQMFMLLLGKERWR